MYITHKSDDITTPIKLLKKKTVCGNSRNTADLNTSFPKIKKIRK